MRTEFCEFWNSSIAFQWSEIRKPKEIAGFFILHAPGEVLHAAVESV